MSVWQQAFLTVVIQSCLRRPSCPFFIHPFPSSAPSPVCQLRNEIRLDTNAHQNFATCSTQTALSASADYCNTLFQRGLRYCISACLWMFYYPSSHCALQRESPSLLSANGPNMSHMLHSSLCASLSFTPCPCQYEICCLCGIFPEYSQQKRPRHSSIQQHLNKDLNCDLQTLESSQPLVCPEQIAYKDCTSSLQLQEKGCLKAKPPTPPPEYTFCCKNRGTVRVQEPWPWPEVGMH